LGERIREERELWLTIGPSAFEAKRTTLALEDARSVATCRASTEAAQLGFGQSASSPTSLVDAAYFDILRARRGFSLRGAPRATPRDLGDGLHLLLTTAGSTPGTLEQDFIESFLDDELENPTMSTKTTLAYHPAEADKPAWHLYEEIGESGVMYLELQGIGVDMCAREQRPRDQGGVDHVLRLPIETAQQLGMASIVPSERWESACERDELGALRRLRGSVTRHDAIPRSPSTNRGDVLFYTMRCNRTV
jgi:hypothetical protein